MATPRNDQDAGPPDQKYGTSETRSPTPNILDYVIVEDKPLARTTYQRLVRGTPHPKVAAAILVSEGPIIGDDHKVRVRRIYATRRSAQNAYNAQVTYDEEDKLFPIYKRTYFIFQDDYTASTRNSPLTELVEMVLTAGGTGYNSGNSGQIPLVFTGGAGTGAAGVAEVVLGVIVAIVLTDGGINYTPTGLPTISAAGGTGLVATAVIQPADCVLVSETFDNAPDEFGSIFYSVVLVYKRLPGPIVTSLVRDPQYGLENTETRQTIAAQGATLPSPVLGQLASIEGKNTVESEEKISALDQDAVANFYLAFEGLASIDLPRTLVSLEAIWDKTAGNGAYSETGTGETAGSDSALSVSLTGRGQGSASVLAELIPRFSEPPFGEVPILDLFFFVPNNTKNSAILTAASAFASDYLGRSVTVNAWPIFRILSQTIIVTGQKASVSSEATARTAYSESSSSVSFASTSGAGINRDLGSNVRAITLPPSLHAPLTIQGDLTNTANAVSDATITFTGDAVLPSQSSPPAAISEPVLGFISHTTIPGTFPQGLPQTGLYSPKVDIEVWKNGYSTVRVRVFDFESITCQQVTLIQFGSLTGANFVTGAAAKAWVLPSQSNGVNGIWINTGTETQPDLTDQGVTTYKQLLISPTETTAGIASKLISQLGAGFAADFVLAAGGATGVFFTSVAKGIQPDAFDVNTTAQIFIIQEGS